jgi:hypothetical protein
VRLEARRGRGDDIRNGEQNDLHEF